MAGGLVKDRSSYAAAQCFAPREGYCNLTVGATEYSGLIAHCAADGDITYNWASGTTDTISCIAGDDFAIARSATVTIDSGTFHIS